MAQLSGSLGMLLQENEGVPTSSLSELSLAIKPNHHVPLVAGGLSYR